MSDPSDNNASDSVSPPIRGRQRSGGNDSLWKRARKTLGANSLTFLQPQSRPTPAAAKAENPSNPTGKTTPGKRREQVRNAQRTHRQRTQNYIKTLESEVIRLRGSEGDLTQANKKLQNQVDLLRTTLILANVQLPPGFEGSPELAQPNSINIDMPATVAFKMDNLNHRRLHVSWPSPPANQPAPAPATLPVQPPGWAPASAQEHSISEWNSGGFKPLPKLPKDCPTTYGNPPLATTSKLDNPEVAIDFVLALEHPCIRHLPHPSDPPSDDPSNHALMVSTPLLSCAPRPFQQSDANWTANASMIKELLNLSSAINLEGEITPVEAWHRLRQHPGFSRLDKWAIERIKGDLSASVRCCGFGAVLDENAFVYAVESILGQA